MKQAKTKCTIVILSLMIAYVSWNSWYRATHPNAFVWCDEDKENDQWLATSRFWLDKKACRYLSICGGLHAHFARHPFGFKLSATEIREANLTRNINYGSDWIDGSRLSEYEKKMQQEIPDYVFEHAPLVHLFAGEQFWPCDPAEHLHHTTPYLNYTMMQSEEKHETLAELNELNQYQNGTFVFLTSNDNIETRPAWLEGVNNIPEQVSAEDATLDDNEGWVHHPPRSYLQGLRDAAHSLGQEVDESVDPNSFDSGDAATSAETVRLLREEAESLLQEELKRTSARSSSQPYPHKIRGGRSNAPAVVVTVPKDDGIVDAFWFFFYSFNLGNSVLGLRFGNHIGDWEHTAVRFKNGKPQAVYFSEHNFGSAYSYEAVEKLGKRPIIYSATGTHAMYSTPGTHPYVLPFGLLHDETSRGPLWDPALNYHGYTYDHKSEDLMASARTPNAPTGWFYYSGHWGDKFYELGDRRQYRFVGQYHYVNGPLGPKFKHLGRKEICGTPDGTPCVLKHWLGTGGKISRSPNHGEEADAWSAAHKAGVKFELR